MSREQSESPVPLKRKQTIRGQNWTLNEDEELCRSWLRVSADPSRGPGHRIDNLWGSIKADFDKNLKTPVCTRSALGLMSRWNIIQEKVSRYNHIRNMIQSPEYKSTGNIDEADMLYLKGSKDNKMFNLSHCYFILRGTPKWTNYLQEKPKKQAVVERMCDPTPNEIEVSTVQPIGRKKQKTVDSKRNTVDSLVSMLDIISANNQKKLKILQESTDMDTLRVDISSLKDPRIRAYFKSKQNAILDKFEKEQELLKKDKNVAEQTK